ncbi:MAG: glycosyltransferase family 2 protein [Chitinophaga sp.]|uniref:glycosyltransferase family 2 protein n=1 Tax=Chitinophaga sp. TaxID=1869181 RepID=UPI001B1E3537|nr:glycosyltransferase family 2 protein [Chitinophaga sp.]MBO9731720.1 glycosyltransferase family 2 protein [Chitinophaga sp.]
MSVGIMITYYNPDAGAVKQLEAIFDKVDKICIVDNSSPAVSEKNRKMIAPFENIEYIPLHENRGIGAAQNIGAAYLFQTVDHLIFLDQDSLPAPDMISQLISSLNVLQKAGVKVGGIGPQAINKWTKEPYKAKIKKGNYVLPDEKILEVSEIISSGTLVSKPIWEEVGGIDEWLFIDGVDHEWCWRATAKGGYRFFINENAHLEHSLGEGDKKIMGVFSLKVPSPIRCYYQYRNYFILCRRKYVPLYWKCMNGIKYSFKMICYPLLLSEKKAYLKYIVKGIKEGIKGR